MPLPSRLPLSSSSSDSSDTEEEITFASDFQDFAFLGFDGWFGGHNTAYSSKEEVEDFGTFSSSYSSIDPERVLSYLTENPSFLSGNSAQSKEVRPTHVTRKSSLKKNDHQVSRKLSVDANEPHVYEKRQYPEDDQATPTLARKMALWQTAKRNVQFQDSIESARPESSCGDTASITRCPSSMSVPSTFSHKSNESKEQKDGNNRHVKISGSHSTLPAGASVMAITSREFSDDQETADSSTIFAEAHSDNSIEVSMGPIIDSRPSPAILDDYSYVASVRNSEGSLQQPRKKDVQDRLSRWKRSLGNLKKGMRRGNMHTLARRPPSTSIDQASTTSHVNKATNVTKNLRQSFKKISEATKKACARVGDRRRKSANIPCELPRPASTVSINGHIHIIDNSSQVMPRGSQMQSSWYGRKVNGSRKNASSTKTYHAANSVPPNCQSTVSSGIFSDLSKQFPATDSLKMFAGDGIAKEIRVNTPKAANTDAQQSPVTHTSKEKQLNEVHKKLGRSATGGRMTQVIKNVETDSTAPSLDGVTSLDISHEKEMLENIKSAVDQRLRAIEMLERDNTKHQQTGLACGINLNPFCTSYTNDRTPAIPPLV